MQLKRQGKQKASSLSAVSEQYNYNFFPFVNCYIDFGCCSIESLHQCLTRCLLKNGPTLKRVLLLSPLTWKLRLMLMPMLLKSPTLKFSIVCKFASLFFLVCHRFIFSVQDGDTNEPSNVMLLSCQDPLLTATYKNLPKIA